MLSTSSSARALNLDAYAASDRGRRRECNEDVALVRADLGLYAVADGAGGHNAGDVAAELAICSLEDFLSAQLPALAAGSEFDRFGFPRVARCLSAAVHQANRAVIEISKTSEQHRGMGTTLVAALRSPHSDSLHVAHVGDSRLYRYRAPGLELLTQDHSLLTDVLEQRPDIDDALLARLPKHVVTRALGMDENLRVSVSSHRMFPDDRYLLCSDGLSSLVPFETLRLMLASPAAPAELAQELIELANSAGGPDNITALVLRCRGESDEFDSDVNEPALDEYDADPEILILGIEELDPSERAHTPSDGLLRAIEELIKRGK